MLEILYHDEHLVAINKPSGLLVHRSAIDKHETQFAMQQVRDQIGQHVFPVHRLDKPTSGVLVFALNADVAKLMGEAFSTHHVKKTYLAVVRGIPQEHYLVDHPLSEEQDKYTDKNANISAPKTAITEFFKLADIRLPVAIDKYPESRYALMKCLPKTGRKHQIRRHLKHLSHPIIGDAKHGKSNHNRFFQQHYNAHRLLLAATEINFIHPVLNEPLRICATLDTTMTQLLHAFNWLHSVPTCWLDATKINSLLCA